MRLTRLRLALIAAIAAVLAIAAGDIFDRTLWRLLLAPALPAATAVLLATRPAILRIVGAAVAVFAGVAVVVALSGGTIEDVADAFTVGVQRMLSTDWPSPDRADLIGPVAAALALATALGCELARWSRGHLVPLLPPLVAWVGIVAMSAPIGVRLRWLLPVGILAIAFAAMHDDAGDDQLSLLRGERRLLPLAGIALATAALVSVPLDLSPRADPRRNDPPERTASLLDPIEATLALRAIDPPIVLHVVTGDELLPTRWRNAALEDYDGERWTPDLVLRPIGRRLGPDEPGAVQYTVRFLDDDLSLVPLTGAPVTVDAPIETDEQRTIVRLLTRPGPDEEIRVTSNVTGQAGSDGQLQIASRPIDESVSGLTELAETLAGDGTVQDRLRAIEQTMRNDFVLETDAPGGGLQRALIERFLRDTERGNAEQFTTSFVLLARSLGVDARVATGFNVGATPSGSEVELQSSDAAIWPEVRLTDGRWIAFDPVPTEEISDAAEPPAEPQVQTPAAPQPPIVPPPDPTDETSPADQSGTDATAGALSTAVVVLVRAVAVAGLLLLPVLVVIAVIVLVKRRRRRRRIGAGAPEDRIRGSWAVATDSLVDAGLTIAPASTDQEIADDGDALAPGATRELHRLATLSSAVTFGAPQRTDLLADDATACLEEVEASLGDSMTRWQYVRWRLSARSLRSKTRSPVDL
ncbi:MAG: DUF3488 and transglutaminase-like domain-containing protein [Ilumatobacteraceae bacterium]